MNKIKNKFLNKMTTIATTISLLAINTNCCLATGGIGTQEVTAATENIKRVIISIAMPLGVVVAAIKMIANANNPQKRADSIGSLAWICGGGVVLGASLIIAGIIINIATNNSGSLLGS